MPIETPSKEIAVGSIGYAPGGQDPDITTLSNGRLLVTWTETLDRPTGETGDVDGAIFARMFTAKGIPLGEPFQVNDWEPFEQDLPQVIAMKNGTFAIAWTNNARYGDHPIDADIFVRFYDKTGEPTGESIVAAGGYLVESVSLSDERIALITEGGAITVLDADGSVLADGPSFSTSSYGNADIAQLEDGNIVWAGTIASGARHSYDIEIHLSDEDFKGPTGIPGQSGVMTFYAHGNSVLPNSDVELAGLANGGFALAYTEKLSNTTSVVNLDLFTHYGAIEFSTTPVSTRAFAFNDEDAEIDMIALSNGGLAMAIATKDANGTGLGIDLLLLDDDGTVLSRVQASRRDIGDQSDPSLTETADGSVAIAFADESGREIGGRVDTLHMATFGVSGMDGVFYGSLGDDLLKGLSGRDKLYGLAGDDTLKGRKGLDRLNGGQDNDALYGGKGNDFLFGGNGNDKLYGEDGNDGLKGGAGNDRLAGNAGADILKGGGGKDKLIGGKDSDIFVFNGDFGADTVKDLDIKGADADTIRMIAGNGEARTFTQFKNAATQKGRDVLYDRGDDGENTILLEDVKLSDLSASDFDFV